MNFQKASIIFLFMIFFGQLNNYAQQYLSIVDLEKICSFNKREDIRKLNALLKSANYTTEKLYANINTFKDPYGNSISTTIIDDKPGAMEIRYSIKNPTAMLINKYKNKLRTQFNNVGFNGIDEYTKEGKYLFTINTVKSSISGQDLIIQVKNNSGAIYPVAAIKIKNSRKIKITSFTNSFSTLYVNKGDSYTLRSDGEIFVGIKAGKTGPNGIDGFETSNYVSGFKHGSLLGKLGKRGKWFLIGTKKTILATENTHLYVKVNDIDPSNNSGYFTFSHDLTPR